MGWRFADHGTLDLAVVGSALTYRASSGAAAGEFNATRFIITSGIRGDFQLGENLTVSPSARVFALWEGQEGWTDSLATDHAARSFANGTASGGLTFSGLGMQLGEMDLKPYLGLFADYRFDSETSTASLVGRVSAGMSVGLSVSASLNIGGELGGLGSEQTTWSLNGGISGGF